VTGRFPPDRLISGLSAAARRTLALPRRITSEEGKQGVISLDRGDPAFRTPGLVAEAAAAAIREGYTHYGDLDGDLELRTHIAQAASARSDFDISPTQVVITPGSTAAVSSVLTTLVDPGDRVVLLDPTYAAYGEQIALVGGVPVRVAFRSDGHLDLAALHRAAGGAKVIILCHPASPTGVVFTREELHALGELLADTGCVLLADEAYADMVYDGRPFTSTLDVPCLRSRLIMSRTLSKTYAMAGWRIGYLVLPPGLAEPVNLVHRTYNLVANAAVQRAALAALRTGPELFAPMLRVYTAHRNMTMAWVRETELLTAKTPEATFYVFARYLGSRTSVDVVQHLTDHGVRVRAGSYDGPSGEHHLRICFAAATPVLTEGLGRLTKGLRAL
jgi:aspartate aminotransferase